MFCPKCGDPVGNDEKFCNKCGNQLVSSPNMQQQNINSGESGINPINNLTNVGGLAPNVNTMNNPANVGGMAPNVNPMNNPANVGGLAPNVNPMNNIPNVNNQYPNMNNGNQKKEIVFMGAGIGIVVLILIFVIVVVPNNSSYYFSNENYNDDEIISTDNNDNSDNNDSDYNDDEDYTPSNNNDNTSQKKGEYSTVIITTNRYENVKINSKSDALSLISKDSTKQKSSCPAAIKAIEDQIIADYNITAVNLCEMDLGFAREIGNVFKVIYNEYPSVRENLTNLSLINATREGYIAAFMPIYPFAEASSGYPLVIKTQLLLNTPYFLNLERLEQAVEGGANAGHFPPNATVYSPIAHELGHYLSFLAMMRSYDAESILLINDYSDYSVLHALATDFADGDFSLLLIEEAYSNYKKDTNTKLSLTEWRATISSYAVTKDNSNNYIYDETIAEGFHDVYINGSNAADASKYIVAVLKEKLEG